MEDQILTPHFRLSEFLRSETAGRLGIDNTFTDPQVLDNLKNLCQQVLEPLREHAQEPVIINSGYRCRELNKAVGGVRNSYHLQGRAADIPFVPSHIAYIRDYLPHTELINEGTWIHVAL